MTQSSRVGAPGNQMYAIYILTPHTAAIRLHMRCSEPSSARAIIMWSRGTLTTGPDGLAGDRQTFALYHHAAVEVQLSYGAYAECKPKGQVMERIILVLSWFMNICKMLASNS